MKKIKNSRFNQDFSIQNKIQNLKIHKKEEYKKLNERKICEVNFYNHFIRSKL